MLSQKNKFQEADQLTSTTRRQLMRKAAAGGAINAIAMPVRWAKPVILAVALPAHAQTTITPAPNLGPVARLNGVIDGAEGTTFIADASASTDPEGDTLTYTFSVTGAGTVQSQTGAQATILRSDVDIMDFIEVRVDVSDGMNTSFAISTATVTDLPPNPPRPAAKV